MSDVSIRAVQIPTCMMAQLERVLIEIPLGANVRMSVIRRASDSTRTWSKVAEVPFAEVAGRDPIASPTSRVASERGCPRACLTDNEFGLQPYVYREAEPPTPFPWQASSTASHSGTSGAR